MSLLPKNWRYVPEGWNPKDWNEVFKHATELWLPFMIVLIIGYLGLGILVLNLVLKSFGGL